MEDQQKMAKNKDKKKEHTNKYKDAGPVSPKTKGKSNKKGKK
jgi:hypothetical protein